MRDKKEISAIVGGIKKFLGKTKPIISHQASFKVLIATALSARTRDANTAKAAKNLFSKYNTPKKLAAAEIKDIEKLIKASGFYKIKARRIKEISRVLLEDFGGKVPNEIDALVSLPGVGRKTANCVLCYAFNIPAIAVDTHVHRISNRLGLVKTKNPEETEESLSKTLPKKYWLAINELMVKFGQRMCLPRSPKCGECPINSYCDYYENIYLPGKRGA
ncbi:MAG: endonuclease III [Candidatus Diapherotrites archaeon]